MPHRNEKKYSSKTVCHKKLKPVCKFEFDREICLTKLIDLDHERTMENSFLPRVPEFSLAGFILGFIWGSMKVKENPLSPGIAEQWPIICSKMFRGARAYKLWRR